MRRETEALQREARLKRDEAGGAENHEGENLAGTVLSSETSPFQLASFDGANLANATLDASFQMAGFADADLSAAQLTGNFQCVCFDNANLTNATLSGKGGSFQFASFAGTDLTGASIKGNFQGARFTGAKLVGVTVLDSGRSAFQCMDIDGTRFEGADLSTIDRSSLESCFFDTPPSCDEETKFPRGFDPRRQGWTVRREKLE